ncbi:hypothetical protein GCM10027072_62060 [Streptomyces bullii]
MSAPVSARVIQVSGMADDGPFLCVRVRPPRRHVLPARGGGTDQAAEREAGETRAPSAASFDGAIDPTSSFLRHSVRVRPGPARTRLLYCVGERPVMRAGSVS